MRYLCLLLSTLIILASCSRNEQAQPKLNTEKREVHDFSRITFAGVGNLVIHQGEKEAVELEASENLLPEITTQVVNGTLYIEEKPIGWLQSLQSRNPFTAHVYLKNIEEITLSGKGVVSAENKIKSKNFTLKTSGSGKVDLTLESDTFTANTTGSADYNLKGKVNDQNIQLSGASSYDALQLTSLHTSIDIRGTGQVSVNAQEQLNVIITGTGVVHYTGKPQVTQKIFGTATIEKLK
jgi:hypothetical protein